MESQATKKYKQASERARQEQLIFEHMDFAQRIYGSLASNLPSSVDQENLQSAGILGLIESAQSFDPSRGVAFKTFAYPRIRGAIVDELRRNSPLSQRVMTRIAKIRSLARSTPEPMTPERIAVETGMSMNDVEECLEAMQLTNVKSLEHSRELRETRAEFESPGARIELEEQLEKLTQYIEQLPERERLVLTMYHTKGLFLKEIGHVLGISESRTSRILSKAQFRLQEMFQKNNA